jgi:hypothetical protein
VRARRRHPDLPSPASSAPSEPRSGVLAVSSRRPSCSPAQAWLSHPRLWRAADAGRISMPRPLRSLHRELAERCSVLCAVAPCRGRHAAAAFGCPAGGTLETATTTSTIPASTPAPAVLAAAVLALRVASASLHRGIPLLLHCLPTVQTCAPGLSIEGLGSMMLLRPDEVHAPTPRSARPRHRHRYVTAAAPPTGSGSSDGLFHDSAVLVEGLGFLSLPPVASDVSAEMPLLPMMHCCFFELRQRRRR